MGDMPQDILPERTSPTLYSSSGSESSKIPLERVPDLRLQIWDVTNPMIPEILSLLDMGTLLQEAYESVLSILYTKHSKIPEVRSITLYLRSFEGVAHTKGNELDDAHKEIHLSLDYVSQVSAERRKEEILGVMRHEMVHVWQWNALGTAPGGLIEGIADFVRLRSDLGPPHWKRSWKKEDGAKWDKGYECSGYFLDWCERGYGEGTVKRINERLRDREWDEKAFFDWCFGCTIEDLWARYCKACEKDDKKS
jgi:hypothetical protein